MCVSFKLFQFSKFCSSIGLHVEVVSVIAVTIETLLTTPVSALKCSICREDRTKTGHALGEPGSRSTNAEPQRDMSPIVCSFLRIIMHSAMVMGAARNPQVISSLTQ